MFGTRTILAFIGARAGSKGLENKNILDLAGKPLIAWTVEASLASKYVDRTIVSTDSQRIAQIAKEAGADVPFLRPAELATDESLLDVAMQHCREWLSRNEQKSYDYILLLQPTSPLRTALHIDEAIRYYFENEKSPESILISVVSAPKKLGWLMQKKKSGYIEFCFDNSQRKSRRQELADYYLPNGAIYFGPARLMTRLSVHTSHLVPFIMGQESSIDIDSKKDLEEAAIKLQLQGRQEIKL